MKAYLQRPKKYLMHISIALIVIGLYQITMLYFAIKNDESYSGASFFYIIGAVLIMKKNRFVFNLIRKSLLGILALVLARIASSILLQVKLLTATTRFLPNYYFSMMDIYLLGTLGAILYLIFIFWKKETYVYFKTSPLIEYTVLKDQIMCLPKKYLYFCAAGSIVLILFLQGPNIFQNPNNLIEKEIIQAYTEPVSSITIKDQKIKNWVVGVTVEINGTSSNHMHASYNPVSKKIKVSMIEPPAESFRIMKIFNNQKE